MILTHPAQRATDVPQVMTIEEVATFLRVNKSTIYRMLKEGTTLPHFRVRGDFRFYRPAIERWCDGQRVEVQNGKRKRKR